MVYAIYSNSAQKDLSKLTLNLADRIISKIKKYVRDKHPLMRAKYLTGDMNGQYRYRIGDYRAIFEYSKDGDTHIIHINKIAHRKDVYE